MAIYHLHAKVGSRSAGKSAVASAAYRSGTKMQDNEYGEERDYTRKGGIDDAFIIAPPNSPAFVNDREKLWNAVEAAERRKDAQVFREVEFSLPVDVPPHLRSSLARKYVSDVFVSRGMIADVAIHDKGDGNPHAHVMLTTREIGPEGFGKKVREWNDRDLLIEWREKWAEYANAELERNGQDSRIDHRTLKAQGIDREPGVHRGPGRDAELKRIEDKLRFVRLPLFVEQQRKKQEEAARREAAELEARRQEQEAAKRLFDKTPEEELAEFRRRAYGDNGKPAQTPPPVEVPKTPVQRYNEIAREHKQWSEVIPRLIASNDPALCKVGLVQLEQAEKQARDKIEARELAAYDSTMRRYDAVYKQVIAEYKGWEKQHPYEKPDKKLLERQDTFDARCTEAQEQYDQRRTRVIQTIIRELSKEAGLADFNDRTRQGGEYDEWTRKGLESRYCNRIKIEAQRTILVDPALRQKMQHVAERPEREQAERERQARGPDRDEGRGGWGR